MHARWTTQWLQYTCWNAGISSFTRRMMEQRHPQRLQRYGDSPTRIAHRKSRLNLGVTQESQLGQGGEEGTQLGQGGEEGTQLGLSGGFVEARLNLLVAAIGNPILQLGSRRKHRHLRLALQGLQCQFNLHHRSLESNRRTPTTHRHSPSSI